jgi:hypothetical protein
MATLPLISCQGPYGVWLGNSSPQGWQLANLILYVPVRIPELITVKRVFWSNGDSAAGNINVGLYDWSGAKQWECGSTAQSGTDVVQYKDITDTDVAAGMWFLALQASSTSTRFMMSGDFWSLWRSGVFDEAAGSFALPSTATFTNPNYGYLPYFGLDVRG